MSAQIQSIQRAAAILRLLSEPARRRGLAELAAELRLPKGTVYGILRTLQTVGFVEQDTESRKYQLGPGLLPIGSSYLKGSELRLRALGCANALAMQAGESVRIGTLHENRVLIVHHILGPGEAGQALELGGLMPLHATALGKVLLANHPHLVEELARPLPAFTTTTVTDPDRLSAELTATSRRGWASDTGEYHPGVASIAAPIKARDGVPVGAVAVSGAIQRVCRDGSAQAAIVGYVMESASRISRELGATEW